MRSPSLLRHRARRDTREKGFTLLEMLVVLAIIALTTALAITTIRPHTSLDVRAAVRGLAVELRSVRDEARRFHRIERRNPEQIAQAVVARTARHVHPTGQLTVGFRAAAPSLVGSDRNGVVFYPDGSSSGGIVTLLIGKSRAVIQVHSLDGRVSVQD